MNPKVIFVKDKSGAERIAKELLYKYSNPKTALFLSGGSTPAILYQKIAKEKKIKAGAVAIVDERFGKKMHINSNEKMILETGLIEYLRKENMDFYTILEDKSINKTSKDYEKKVSDLFSRYKNKIAVLGIGIDGHTAGLPAGIKNYELRIKNDLVSSFDNFPGEFPKRITLTFLALSKLDLIIILALGENKKKAIKMMFKKGLLEEIPARFFLKKGIAEKTILITDQKI